MLLDRNCGRMPAEVLAVLNEANIEGRHLWKPMHMQPVFSGCGFAKVEDRAVSEELFESGVCLPSDTKMTPEQQMRVCETIKKLF